VRQAGGIVVRGDGDRERVLVVTARRSRKRWVLPKGSVERDETPAAAALREVQEEAGVTGRIVCPAGRVAFPADDGQVRIDYFLIDYTARHESAGEQREVRWLAVEDALRRLTYASARRVLLEAYPRIAERWGVGAGRGARRKGTSRAG
jgi:8-oxo-dGTP pyrophosphatase MutT (NUDIX family)